MREGECRSCNRTHAHATHTPRTHAARRRADYDVTRLHEDLISDLLRAGDQPASSITSAPVTSSSGTHHPQMNPSIASADSELRDLYRKTERTLDRSGMRSPWLETSSQTEYATSEGESSVATPVEAFSGKIAAVFVAQTPIKTEEERYRAKPRERERERKREEDYMAPPPLASMPIAQRASQVRRPQTRTKTQPHPPTPFPPSPPPPPPPPPAVDMAIQVSIQPNAINDPRVSPPREVRAVSTASTSLPPTPRVHIDRTPVATPTPTPVVSSARLERSIPKPQQAVQQPTPDAARKAYYERQKAAEVARRAAVALSAAAEAQAERARAEEAAAKAARMLQSAVDLMAGSSPRRTAKPSPATPQSRHVSPPREAKRAVAAPVAAAVASPKRGYWQNFLRHYEGSKHALCRDERRLSPPRHPLIP